MNQEVDPVMKKLLLLGFVLAICILAMPQGVLAIDQPVTVNAVYYSATTFVVTNNVGTWTLAVDGSNTNPAGLSFDIKTLDDWSVSASAGNGGYMTGSNGDLKSRFEMDLRTTPALGFQRLDLATPKVANSGGPSSVVQHWTSNLYQPVLFNDYGSASATGYAITLTFTSTTDF